jgi:hypothetical protein
MTSQSDSEMIKWELQNAIFRLQQGKNLGIVALQSSKFQYGFNFSRRQSKGKKGQERMPGMPWR